MNSKEILMYFHTTLRNVGLYTSISLAMLGYSRFYRGKDKIYNISFIFISLLFLIFSIRINYILHKTVSVYKQSNKETDPVDMLFIDDMFDVPIYILATNSIVFLFGLYTLINEIKK